MSANIKHYLSAFHTSQTFADELGLCSYPVDIFDVIDGCNNILVSSFSDYKVWANCQGLPCNDTLKDAKCYKLLDRNIFMIVYNERQPKKRITFSLAHELAHIVLGHLDDERTEIERGGLDDYTYFMMEGAANTFAGNFLAPPILIHEVVVRMRFHADSIAQIFGLSKQAVQEYRKQDYQYWLCLPHTVCEERILNRCKQHYYTFYCPQCRYFFSIEQARHCPICGTSIIHRELEDRADMGRRFPAVELTKAGRLVECINCENEDIADNASFCMICGKPVVNLCLSAISDNQYQSCDYTKPLPSNARYCPYCGSITTFFDKEILCDWTQVPKEESGFGNMHSNSIDNYDDSDLPF